MCVAIPGEVIEIEGNTARVEVSGSVVPARIDLLSEDVEVGDYLLVHAGFAINKVDKQEAEEVRALWAELGGASW
ncbi:MAG TPA: hypothetical protein DGT21_01090 [Armatimonadetes bacterium]|jgi:hydrogenase expression/formation protein HypC|nr:hypothetical protein [Armatimonadota bacterium]